MPFKCALCELDIQPGEAMLSDEKMNLAHESCIRRGRSVDPPTVIDVAVPRAPEPCLMPSPPKVCVECQKPAISMCPACDARVHHDYGYGGANCSGRHEGKCARAGVSRDLPKPHNPIVQPLYEIEVVSKASNGKHKTPKRGRR